MALVTCNSLLIGPSNHTDLDSHWFLVFNCISLSQTWISICCKRFLFSCNGQRVKTNLVHFFRLLPLFVPSPFHLVTSTCAHLLHGTVLTSRVCGREIAVDYPFLLSPNRLLLFNKKKRHGPCYILLSAIGQRFSGSITLPRTLHSRRESTHTLSFCVRSINVSMLDNTFRVGAHTENGDMTDNSCTCIAQCHRHLCSVLCCSVRNWVLLFRSIVHNAHHIYNVANGFIDTRFVFVGSSIHSRWARCMCVLYRQSI